MALPPINPPNPGLVWVPGIGWARTQVYHTEPPYHPDYPLPDRRHHRHMHHRPLGQQPSGIMEGDYAHPDPHKGQEN